MILGFNHLEKIQTTNIFFNIKLAILIFIVNVWFNSIKCGVKFNNLKYQTISEKCIESAFEENKSEQTRLMLEFYEFNNVTLYKFLFIQAIIFAILKCVWKYRIEVFKRLEKEKKGKSINLESIVKTANTVIDFIEKQSKKDNKRTERDTKRAERDENKEDEKPIIIRSDCSNYLINFSIILLSFTILITTIIYFLNLTYQTDPVSLILYSFEKGFNCNLNENGKISKFKCSLPLNYFYQILYPIIFINLIGLIILYLVQLVQLFTKIVKSFTSFSQIVNEFSKLNE